MGADLDRLLSSHACPGSPEATEPGLGTGGFQGSVARSAAVIVMHEWWARTPQPRACHGALPLPSQQAWAWGHQPCTESRAVPSFDAVPQAWTGVPPVHIKQGQNSRQIIFTVPHEFSCLFLNLASVLLWVGTG